ncbi:hypothetical protein INT43_006118 [Umbelopsis isabellina]|uniref:Uncharacterized protein n=1 Tax=Mortierella isabellina TaxID=91625 RepID=A0A8H7U7Y5_MORIS|nr:hypothetical protein INT43_006118 [Umbelopsis isabellina]
MAAFDVNSFGSTNSVFLPFSVGVVQAFRRDFHNFKGLFSRGVESTVSWSIWVLESGMLGCISTGSESDEDSFFDSTTLGSSEVTEFSVLMSSGNEGRFLG